tara:strand:+ start:301 stop:1701 length:1401 start_codon:yes stop_codon:yes gene_type:complete
MKKLFVFFFGLSFLTYSFSQNEYNLSIQLNGLDSIVFSSSNHIDNRIIVYNDTLMTINTNTNNLFYIERSNQYYYLFMKNGSLLDVECLEGNTFKIEGEYAEFTRFINEYLAIYDPQINLLLSQNLSSDEFEIKLYEIINKNVFFFYMNHQFYNIISELENKYFKDLLKYKYLSTLSSYLINQTRDTLQGLPYYTDVNIDLLSWDNLMKHTTDSTYYDLNIYQNYIFDGLVLFALHNYKYLEKSSFQLFNNYLFSFIIEYLPDYLVLPFFNDYLIKFSRFLDSNTVQYLENSLKSINISKSEIIILLNHFLLNNNDKNLPNKQEENFKHQFYLEDINGNSTSLSSFEGQVLYIDLWASWCGPCRNQFPYAKKLKSKLSKRQLKKIKFIYISIDNDYDKWKESIVQLDIEGYHFISPSNNNNSAGDYFAVSSIPRYIIMNQQGEIIQENAKRPSDDTLLDDLIELIK